MGNQSVRVTSPVPAENPTISVNVLFSSGKKMKPNESIRYPNAARVNKTPGNFGKRPDW